MLRIFGAVVFGFALALPCAATAEPDALELDWDAPSSCPDEDAVERLVSQHLGERTAPRAAPLVASGRISVAAQGFALSLRTPTGERRLDAASCDELAQSAAVILALLIDPRALPAPAPSPTTTPEPEPEPEAEPADSSPTPAANSAARFVHGFVRAELAGDAGLLPHVGLGPGVAGGVVIYRTTIELSGTYLPTHDVTDEQDRDAGDLRAFIGRLGACHSFVATPEVGPCAFAEYTRLVGRGDDALKPVLDVDAGLWSLLLAARLSVGIGASFGWMLEIGLGLPLSVAEFTAGAREPAQTVHKTNGVVGRARTGLELRF